MSHSILKTKSITALLLVLALVFIFVPMDSYESDLQVLNTHTSQSNMMFSQRDITATFFLSEKVNQYRESHFTGTKNKRKFISFENQIESLQPCTCDGPFFDYRVNVFPFYVMLCVLIVHVVIKYIYNKDGKKRTSYLLIR